MECTNDIVIHLFSTRLYYVIYNKTLYELNSILHMSRPNRKSKFDALLLDLYSMVRHCPERNKLPMPKIENSATLRRGRVCGDMGCIKERADRPVP